MSGEWERLDARVIWVDLVRMLLSLVPMAVTALVFGGDVTGSVLWPAAFVAVTGVTAAVGDLLRWAKTRYRITDERLEVRSGIVVRAHRSVRRDRIRSVDTTARLRHRLAGLRIVTIRAGDRTGGSGDSAPLRLDAVSRATAARLQAELPAGTRTRTGSAMAADTGTETGSAAADDPIAVFAWRWVPYNAVTVWAFLTAAGLAWGAYWLGSAVGVDLAAAVLGLADRAALGTGRTIAAAVVVTWLVGVVGMGAAFVAEQWGFRLTRTTTPTGTVLRTSHGLFRTRQVDRDDARVRGVAIRRPLPWRWTSAAETSVVSTGLGGAWSSAPTVLPRAPLADARRVAAAVLGDDRPLAAPLTPHPRAALRRRLGWAVLGSAALSLSGLVVPWGWYAGPVALPVALGLAVLAYRSLGHALVGRHLVTSSGLNRTTVVLRRGAVIGVTMRQSLLQRRLGLLTVRVTTAGGQGEYPTPDVAVADGVALAAATVPGLLDQFRGEPSGSSATVSSAA